MKAAALMLAALLLAGCAVSSTVQPTSNWPPISRARAIEIAVLHASSSWPEVSGPVEPPTNVQTRLMTLLEAVKILDSRNNVPTSYQPGMMVWLVTMDGKWLDEAEAPQPAGLPNPPPRPYRHYFLILDAVTGQMIEGQLRPGK